VVVALLALVPAAARADSTITQADGPPYELTWTDEPGSATALIVSYDVQGAGVDDDLVVFTSSDPIDVSGAAQCANATPEVAECLARRAGGVLGFLWLMAGDQVDSVALDGTTITSSTFDVTQTEIHGGEGDDELAGAGGYDVIHGGDGNDVLRGGGRADELQGGAGNDTFALGSGDGVDEVDGGSGAESGQGDVARYVASSVGVTISLDGVANDGPDGENLLRIESAEGSLHDDSITLGASGGTAFGNDGDDELVGGAGADALYGEDGADTLAGGGGTDTVSGGSGSDELDGGSGADSVTGGEGDDLISNVVDGAVDLIDGGETGEIGGDTVTYAGSAVGVTITLDEPAEDDGPDLEALDATIENLVGSDHADQLVGSDDPNIFRGGGGDDLLTSRGNFDILLGGGGADDFAHVGFGTATVSFEEELGAITLAGLAVTGADGSETLAAEHTRVIGSPFADSLAPAPAVTFVDGRGGADSIVGGAGADSIRGGSGDDTLDARDSTVDTAIDCGDGAGDVARVDTVAAGGVDDPAPAGCESINPPLPPVDPGPGVDPTGNDPAPDPTTTIATGMRLTAARVVRSSCSRAQRPLGVRDGARRWCFRVVGSARVTRTDTGAALAGQRVAVHRLVGRRQVAVGTATTDARGVATVRRVIVIPRAARTSLAAANRWLADSHRTLRARHAPTAGFAAAASTTRRIVR
jgi:Ca2+-binding RTX toxin-like protein